MTFESRRRDLLQIASLTSLAVYNLVVQSRHLMDWIEDESIRF